MNGIGSALPAVYLKPGEMYFPAEPGVVVTAPGSCLSVTMFRRRRGLKRLTIAREDRWG